MRIMGMISAVLVLIATFVAVKSLTAFGYGAREIFGILGPMAIVVALFFAGLTYGALWWVRRLNRASDQATPPARARTVRSGPPGAVASDGSEKE